ncbi:HepT-like ribonuclease domain-containing protein [Zoogloea sp.]
MIGELAAKLLEHYSDFVAGYPSVPWSSMKGMRNRIAHGYFE